MSSKNFNSFKDFQSDQIQTSSRKLFTAHYACSNSDLNLTPVTGTTNRFIFQIINSLIEFWGLRLTCFDCNVGFCMPSLIFTIPTGTDRRARNRYSKHRWSNFSCLFERAEIQIPVNKYECPQRLSFSPRNLFWGSFTNHNTGSYLRHGINITTNQRLSPTFQGNDYRWRFTNVSSPYFSWGRGEGTSVHRLSFDWLTIVTPLVSGESTLHQVTGYTFWSSIENFFCLLPSLARLYSAAASPSSRLRSDGSLAVNEFEYYVRFELG